MSRLEQSHRLIEGMEGGPPGTSTDFPLGNGTERLRVSGVISALPMSVAPSSITNRFVVRLPTR